MQETKRVWIETFSKSVLFLFWASFFFVHIYSFLHFHKVSLLLFAISESIVAVLFLVRKNAVKVTNNPADYLVTFIGTFLIFFYRPTSSAGRGFSELILIIGLMLLIYSTLSLGRSFGLVPANRGIKAQGAYKLIRHPIYFSYFVLYFGYITDNISFWNISLFVIIATAQITRIYMEESLLNNDQKYLEYKRAVKYKLIPGVF